MCAFSSLGAGAAAVCAWEFRCRCYALGSLGAGAAAGHSCCVQGAAAVCAWGALGCWSTVCVWRLGCCRVPLLCAFRSLGAPWELGYWIAAVVCRCYVHLGAWALVPRVPLLCALWSVCAGAAAAKCVAQCRCGVTLKGAAATCPCPVRIESQVLAGWATEILFLSQVYAGATSIKNVRNECP